MMGSVSTARKIGRDERTSLALAGMAAVFTFAVDPRLIELQTLAAAGLALAAEWAGTIEAVSAGTLLTQLPPAIRYAVHVPTLRRPWATPVSGMRSFWGLLLAYWASTRWVEAWSLTVGIFALTTVLSKSSVWAATASADFLSSIVRFHSPPIGVDPVAILLAAVAAFAAIHLGRIAGTGVRHFLSTTLHRKARGWMQEQFSSAILAQNHIAVGLMGNRDATPGKAGRMPDNVDQRIDECTTNLFAGTIGLAMGVWGSAASIYFISIAIIERSVEVPFLERWFEALSTAAGTTFGPTARALVAFSPGEYGSALLVAVLIAIYVPAGTFCAWCMGRVLERQTLRRQARDGTWRGELNDMLGRSGQLAISHGQRVQARTNRTLYSAIDRVWHRMNVTTAAFLVFTDGYSFLSKRLVSYLPALPAYIAGAMTFRSYAATSELAAELINDCSWFIQVMPAIAALKANAARLTEVAAAVEKANDQRRFYGETGVHEFRQLRQDRAFGLTLKNVALRHRGHDAEPFLHVPHLSLRPGQWAYVRGHNGCGKSSLLKAIVGLWPYGSGDVAHPEGATAFFAGQDPDLPGRLTLKELVAYPDFAEAHSDVDVAAVLADVGLGPFIRNLDDDLHHGKPWNGVFSGGQRQRLVLARILLHRPDLLLLDEACSALDPAAVLEFHRLIRERCPKAIVLAIMHDPEPPVGPTGTPYYDSLLLIEDGQAEIYPLGIAPHARHSIAAE